MKKQWAIIAAIVLIILVSVLAMLNMDPVPVYLGFANFEWPLILVILGSLLIGVVISTLISTAALYTSRRENKELEKKVQALEASQAAKVTQVREEYNSKIEFLESDKQELKKIIQELERERQNRQATSIASDLTKPFDPVDY